MIESYPTEQLDSQDYKEIEKRAETINPYEEQPHEMVVEALTDERSNPSVKSIEKIKKEALELPFKNGEAFTSVDIDTVYENLETQAVNPEEINTSTLDIYQRLERDKRDEDRLLLIKRNEEYYVFSDKKIEQTITHGGGELSTIGDTIEKVMEGDIRVSMLIPATSEDKNISGVGVPIENIYITDETNNTTREITMPGETGIFYKPMKLDDGDVFQYRWMHKGDLSIGDVEKARDLTALLHEYGHMINETTNREYFERVLKRNKDKDLFQHSRERGAWTYAVATLHNLQDAGIEIGYKSSYFKEQAHKSLKSYKDHAFLGKESTYFVRE